MKETKQVVKLIVPASKAKRWKENASSLNISRSKYLVDLIDGKNPNDNFAPNEKEILFTKFWGKYPRKQGSKKNAMRSFSKLNKTQINDLFNALPIHLKYWELSGTEMAYIPHATTWINQQRWEDEINLDQFKISSSKKIDVVDQEVKQKPRQLSIFEKVFSKLSR